MKNPFLKPNPYAFPFVNFEDLSKKSFKDFPEKRSTNFNEIKVICSTISDLIGHKQLQESKIQKKTTPEILFDFFMEEGLRFGPNALYYREKNDWAEKFSEAIANKLITFTILGFPFKVPNPLKTNRKYPDLAELVALGRLESIAKSVETLTNTKTVIHIVTEGAFCQFVGLSIGQAERYEKQLEYLAKKIGFTHLRFTPLKKMEKTTSNFSQMFIGITKEMTKKYNEKDKEIVKRVSGAYPIILRIVKPTNADIHTLMDVYNLDIPNKKLSRRALGIRKTLQKNALLSTIQYFSYLQCRDILQFMETNFGKNHIALTVAPKKERLGIIPIDKSVKILPHQGVPVYDAKKGKFSITYLIDILANAGKYRTVYLINDKEKKPFFYEKI